MKSKPLLGMIAFIMTFLLDQASKWAVLSALGHPPYKIELTSFFNIILVWNKGISFGLFPAGSPAGIWVLIAIAALLSLTLTIWMFQAESLLQSFCFGMILGGALGNILDRIRFGAVTDFLDFHVLGYHWYTFNIADSGIVVGVLLILLQQACHLYKEKQNQNG
jgi:signal peptidase II